MSLYVYEDLTPAPCLPYIISQVYYGAIEGQMDLGEMGWSEDTRTLTVQWGHDLTPTQKAALDAVVSASLGKERVSKERTKIVEEIFWTGMATGGLPLVLRFCDAFDAIPSTAMALDNFNYELARMRVQKMADDGHLTQDEVNLMLSKIPEHEYV